MDNCHFDALTRVLTAGDSRRRVLAVLATLPILGGLPGNVSPEETAAKDRRRRRKQRHKKRNEPGERKGKGKKGCRPSSMATVCAGRCGEVKSRQTCGKPVDCGPCDQCGSGATCSGSTPDCCGSPGSCTTMQTDAANCGTCGNACSGNTPVCRDGVCVCGDVCPRSCKFTTVQEALDALPAGSTIRVCSGTYPAITISKDVTLIGVGDGANLPNNSILSGQGAGRVITIEEGVTVSLQGLRVTQGLVSNDNGGGIWNMGNLAMTGCTVTDNHAEQPPEGGYGSAGGILNDATATLTMTNCTISDNSAGFDTGGIDLLQGAHTFTNCTFSGNTAGRFAGALRMNNGGSATFTGCTVGPGNNAAYSAMVVWNRSRLTLDDTTVSGNDATSGGGVHNASGVVNLRNGSTVSDNFPNNCVGDITGDGCA